MCDDETEITLTSNDGVNVTVAYKYINMSDTIKNICEDTGGTEPVPLPEVNGETLRKLVEYTIYHGDHPILATDPQQEQVSAEFQPTLDQNSTNAAWDAEYVKVDQPKLFELILAANYLAVKPLLDLTCKTVANMIKGKTPEQIREIFGIENDFTPEEEEAVRKENEWCEV